MSGKKTASVTAAWRVHFAGNRMSAGPHIEGSSSDPDRTAIWYCMTEVSQEITISSSRYVPRDAKILNDLMRDAWLIWDRDWAGSRSIPIVMITLIERIGEKVSSPTGHANVIKLVKLIADYGNRMGSPRSC